MEFVPPDSDAVVFVVDGQGSVRETTLFTLIPDHFGPQHLK
jgi:hypothetical protein